MFKNRRRKAVDIMTQAGLDALVFCRPVNLRYLCGFSGSDGAIVLTADKLVFLTDSRYTTQAQEQVAADAISEYKVKAQGVIDSLKGAAVQRIGFESELPYGVAMELRERGESSWYWMPLKDELAALRLHKSPEEVELLSAAAELNAQALCAVFPKVRPGARERDIAVALEIELRNRGADDKAFDIIVASGPRGALPHGIASERLLCNGELVTIDFGCRRQGYHSDETVTLALGAVDDEARRVFDTVLEAHDRALEAVRPGVSLADIDRVARDHIAEAGYGDYFGHGLGHGVGLEVHETPVVSPRGALTAEPGMVFTIEPGIYLPGRCGARIEDMVLVTEEGHRVLTKISKTFADCLIN